MPRSSRFITIEGQYASGVLGTFKIIRGFARLQDLAAISAPYELSMAMSASDNIQGYQRSIDPEHAADIKRYLEEGSNRFLPEIIISIRAQWRDELDAQQRPVGVIADPLDGLTVRRRFRNRNIQIHEIKIDRRHIDTLVQGERRIRRIDGNHRLHLAEDLLPDPYVSTKYLAPFCIVLLGPPGDANDDYVESMLFHTINSTGLSLDSEHALQLILGQAVGLGPTPDEEFASSASLHLTRVLKRSLEGLPTAQRQRLGATPATVLHAAAKAMVARIARIKSDRQELQRFADDLSGALTDVLVRMRATTPDLYTADFFIELASLVWHDSKGSTHDERVSATATTLDSIGRWLGRDGLHKLHGKQSLAQQLFELYCAVRSRIPRRIFLARWYPVTSDGEELHKANLRKQQLDRSLEDLRAEGLDLALDDPGTQEGSTFPIHQKMFEALARNDIILVDLSGVRPNVCIEAGYALRHHEKGRLVFIFQPTTSASNNPSYEHPPFDLSTFRYERIRDAAEIPDKIKPHLKAIVREAEIG